MTESGAIRNPFIDCLSAIDDDADFPPGQKIRASDLLSALIQTVEQCAQTEGALIQPEVFITKLKHTIAHPRSELTHDIILSVHQSIDELEKQQEQQKQANKQLSSGILVLQFALVMLESRLKREAERN